MNRKLLYSLIIYFTLLALCFFVFDFSRFRGGFYNGGFGYIFISSLIFTVIIFILYLFVMVIIRLIEGINNLVSSSKIKNQQLFSSNFLRISLRIAEIFFTILVPILEYNDINGKPDYQVPTDYFYQHTPLAHQYLSTFLVPMIIALVSYWIGRLYFKKLSPILKVCVILGILSGIIFSTVYGVQVSHYPIELFPVVPLILIFAAELLHEHAILVQEQTSRTHWIFLKNKTGLFGFVILAIFPFLILIDCILVLFGQKPDAPILALTQTCYWFFAKHPCPTPAPLTNGHYLCTVASKGHKQLIRPIRQGIRGNEIIVVNRQLLVANAFENWFEDYASTIHRVMRKTYDAIGIPIYKMIDNVWISDIVYILMKPLEFFFTLWLYTFDQKPENRIATQYLPQRNKFL